MANVASESEKERAALLARCAAIGTATWSDAMDDLAISGIVLGLTKRSGEGRCAGFARTARGEVAELGTFKGTEFGLDRMLSTAARTHVLAVELGGAEVSTMGGVGALSARMRGIEGVIIDGGCRDAEDIQASGLWVASRFVTPRTGKRRVKLGSFGEPARIGGVLVRNNDLIVADATGIVILPQERIMELLANAEQMDTSDRRKEQALRSGQSLEQARESAKN
jgi:regulator of RNase E activity RraA